MDYLQIEKTMWALVALYWLIASFFVKKTVMRESMTGRSGYIICVLIGFSLLFQNYWPWKFIYQDCLPQNAVWKISGLILCAAGILFAIVARIYLGKNWSGNITLKKDHELVQSGPYGITRNPIYTGFLFGFLGCAVTLGQIRGIIGLVFLFWGVLTKISIEEKFMTRAFGETFLTYKAKVSKLIPWLY